MTTTPLGIEGIIRTDTKQTDLTVAQYSGQARPGELVIDLTTYVVYVANLTGHLFPLSVGTTGIFNGNTSMFIPGIDSNIYINVSPGVNTVVITNSDMTLTGNLIPGSNNIYSLGNATNQWKDLWLSNSTLYFDGLPLSVDANSNLTFAGATVLTETPGMNTVISSNLEVMGEANLASNLLVSGNTTLTGDVALTGNITVAGTSTLGDVANVFITGGNLNDFLRTNGSGNLEFVNLPTSNGTSFIDIPVADGNINMTSNGVLMVNITDTEVEINGDIQGTGNIAVTGNITAGNIAAPGNLTVGNVSVLSNASLPNPTSWFVPGGNFGDVLTTNGSGGVTWQQLGNGAGGSYIANVSSNVVIPVANGNVYAYINTAPVMEISDTKVVFYNEITSPNVTTDLIQGNSINVTINSNSFVSTFDTVGNVLLPNNLTVASNVQVNNSITVSNTVSTANLASNTNANLTGNATISGNVTIDGNIQITNSAVVIANVIAGNFNVQANLWTNTLANLDSLRVRGVSNLGPAANLRLTGGTLNQVLTSNGAGGVSWANVTVTGVTRIANGTSFAEVSSFGGTVVLFSAINGVKANIADQLYVDGNLVANSNLIVQQGSFLGDVGNVKILGGTLNQVLITDGSGGLSWFSIPGIAVAPNIANGTSNVEIATSGGPVVVGVAGNASILTITGTGVNVAGTSNVTGISNVGANLNVVGNISVGANIAVTGNATINQITSTAVVRETAVALGAAAAIDLALGSLFYKTINAATTFTVTNIPTSGKIGRFVLQLTNGGSSPISWWAGIKWPGGSPPLLAVAGIDVLTFYTYDGGTSWIGYPDALAVS